MHTGIALRKFLINQKACSLNVNNRNDGQNFSTVYSMFTACKECLMYLYSMFTAYKGCLLYLITLCTCSRPWFYNVIMFLLLRNCLPFW